MIEHKDKHGNENMIEGRNAVLEALRSGKPVDKLFVLDGCEDGPVKSIIRAAKAHVLIDIDMMDTLSQIINVEFGVEFLKTIGDLTRLIEKAKAGEAAVSDINTLLNNILEK